MNNRKERGAVLIVSLIFLLLMTLLGVTAMRMTMMQERMAGNLREAALTFQAAEVGLSTAENQLQQGIEPQNMVLEGDIDPNYLTNTTWDNAALYTEAQLTVSLANIATNPRYIVKFLGTWDPDKNVSSLDPGFSGYGLTSNAITVAYYRITARGYGQTGNTFRTVQSFFGR